MLSQWHQQNLGAGWFGVAGHSAIGIPFFATIQTSLSSSWLVKTLTWSVAQMVVSNASLPFYITPCVLWLQSLNVMVPCTGGGHAGTHQLTLRPAAVFLGIVGH
jgi:hypothetical protein